MTAEPVRGAAAAAADERSRRAGDWMLRLALLGTLFGVLHHLDHVARGNHVGWPVVPAVTPFTLSLLVYPFLIGGAYATARGRRVAWYWLVVALAIFALVAFVHFHPAPEGEQPKDLYLPYAEPAAYCAGTSAADRPVFRRILCEPAPAASRPWLGAVAVADMLALVLTLALLILVSALEVWRERRAGEAHIPGAPAG